MLWFEILMTKLGVGNDKVNPITTGWGEARPLKLNRVRQCDASSAPVDPQTSRQVPSHQMSTLGPQLQDIQGVKQLCTVHERQAFVNKHRDTLPLCSAF